MIIRGSDLPPLGWQSKEPYDPTLWDPIGIGLIPVKPFGGLWTSPLCPDGTAWTQWCEREHYGSPDAPIYRVIPAAEATVFVIDDLEALEDFQRRFYRPGGWSVPLFPAIDWPTAAKAIDAVWLTDRGQIETRFTSPGLYGWDCSTVLWLRQAFEVGEVIKTAGRDHDCGWPECDLMP